MKTHFNRTYKLTIGALFHRICNRGPFSGVRKIIRGNNSINHKNAKFSEVVFDITGEDNAIEIKEDCTLNNVTFYIRGNNHKVLIDKNCRFNRGGSVWIEDHNCCLIIGENSTFEDVHIAVTEPGSQIRIGRDCMFAYDIDIRTGDSHSIISQENNERINYAKDVLIGDHVWVAAHSCILKGSSISENSVVATGSIVTQVYEKKGIIIGGNPSRQLQEGITWSRKRIYKTS